MRPRPCAGAGGGKVGHTCRHLCSHAHVHNKNGGTPLAKSPDWLKAAPMWENLLASWRQSGQKKDYYPFLLNHNAKYKRLLPPCCDFANGVRRFVIQPSRRPCSPVGASQCAGRLPTLRLRESKSSC